jgi:hypothetical protein
VRGCAGARVRGVGKRQDVPILSDQLWERRSVGSTALQQSL